MTEEQAKNSFLSGIGAGLDLFDPFQGFVDEDKQLNLRYGFKLGEINLLINQMMMCEVIQNAIIYPIPNTPSWILGLVNLRGILVPVLNLKKHLKQDNERGKILLVLDRGERAFATFVDGLPKSINLDKDNFVQIDIPQNAPEVLKGFIQEAYSLNNEDWLEINFDTFIKHITKDFSVPPSANDAF